jgi:hypothetical protein
MKKLTEIWFTILCLSLFSCSSNSEDDLILPTQNTGLVKYTQNIKPIMESNCVGCHGNSNPNAGLSLTNFNQVRQAILNNGLIDRISKQSGDPQLMPTSGRMPQQTIDLIIKWQTDGLLE